MTLYICIYLNLHWESPESILGITTVTMTSKSYKNTGVRSSDLYGQWLFQVSIT